MATRRFKPETRNPESEARNLKPGTQNPEPETPNPKPQTFKQGLNDAYGTPRYLELNPGIFYPVRYPNPGSRILE